MAPVDPSASTITDEAPPAGQAVSTGEGQCLNCGATLCGAYCHDCGQRDIDPRASLWEVLGEFVQESLELDGRLPRTLVPFIFRPGYLAHEFMEGRRQQYTSPVRLYVFAALVSFFLLAKATSVHLDDQTMFADESGVHIDSSQDNSTVRMDLESRSEDGRLHFDDPQEVPPALRELDGMDPRAAARRLIGGFFEWAPVGAAGLLFVYALLLKLFFPRVPVLTHVVTSTHAHAFALIMMGTGAIVGHTLAAPVVFIVVLVYVGVGLWQAYRQPWWKTVLKFAGLGVLYTAFALAALAGVAMAMLFLS